jgi:single-strand DNA-binding protein
MNPDSTPSINTHILLGRVKDEPVLRFTQSGTAKLAFKLRTERPQPDGRIFSDSHKVVAWGRSAEGFGRDLREGDIVSVTGRIGSRKWEKNDGTVVWITETTVETMAVYSAHAPEVHEPAPVASSTPPPLFAEDEEIPF